VMEALDSLSNYWNLILGFVVLVGLVFTLRERIRVLEEKVRELWKLFNERCR